MREYASIEELRKCLEWLDACKRLGWLHADMKKLESLWWQHHAPGKAPPTPDTTPE